MSETPRVRTLSVVCPVYDEEEVILEFHAELTAVLRGLGPAWRATVVYVVGRSSDRTAELLRSVATADPSVRLILLSNRFGQQAALLAGIDYCDSDAIVMLDSDLQHPPALLPELLAEYEKGNDIVYTVREESSEIPWPKRTTARLFYRLLNALSQTPIHQGAADFRLISRRVARVFRRQIHERSVFLRGLFNWVGFRSAAVRFQPGRRRAGRSKYSLAKMLDFAAHGVVSFSRTPLRAAVVTGGGLVALAIAGALLALLALASGRGAPSAPHALALLILLLCGLQLLFLGIVGEYLGRVLDEVQARPRYLVDELVNFPDADDAAIREPATASARER
jgi:glycosyltransferase involved in cell wall biosynthesis